MPTPNAEFLIPKGHGTTVGGEKTLWRLSRRVRLLDDGGGRYNRGFRPLLGRRSTVGHRALDAVIGVRIPTSQPDFARA